jgi:pimeloyl-ACP methyl ester carboxylesterase
MADLIKALLLKENIEQPVIIGHSMGGYITLAFIEKYPDLQQHLAFFIHLHLQIMKRRKQPGKKH